jgi:hypothetical protein
MSLPADTLTANYNLIRTEADSEQARRPRR